jgi:hypothetical protein
VTKGLKTDIPSYTSTSPPADSRKDDQDTPDNDGHHSEGFWREFFLLRPDRPSLRRLFDQLSPADLLHLEGQTRELFSRSIKALKGGDAQGAADLHALDVWLPGPARYRPCLVILKLLTLR